MPAAGALIAKAAIAAAVNAVVTQVALFSVTSALTFGATNAGGLVNIPPRDLRESKT